MAQWWERSPLTNVSRVRLPDPASYVGWVCCWFSSLLREVFFVRVLRFVPLLKNQHFQITIRSWNARTFLTPWCSVGKKITLLFTFINVSGNKSSVLSSKGFEKAILEIPHQVHDVVSKTRRTEGYHGRIRTSKCGHEWWRASGNLPWLYIVLPPGLSTWFYPCWIFLAQTRILHDERKNDARHFRPRPKKIWKAALF